MSPRVAVIGGGVSGLAAARDLAGHLEVELFEASAEYGGKLRTTSFRRRPLDLGADAFLVRNPAALHLAVELGIGDTVIHPASRRAAIWGRGGLHPMPTGLAIGIPTSWRALWSSGVVSRPAALRAGADLFWRGRLALNALGQDLGGSDDPSVQAVLGPRLGSEVLRHLVDPLIGGINASDISALSFSAALPQLVPALSGARSVMRALAPLAAPSGASRAVPPLFAGLEGGVGSLSAALAQDLQGRGVLLHAESPILEIAREAKRWRVTGTLATGTFDALVLALPGAEAGRLLRASSVEAAELAAAIPYAGVVTATFAFPTAAVPSRISAALSTIAAEEPHSTSASVLPGAGVLVTRGRDRLITAASFTSTKWPRSANEDEVVIRTSAGRHGDARALELDDDNLVIGVLGDLSRVLGITSAPLDRIVSRFPASFPQYTSGHGARLRALRGHLEDLPPIALAGAAYDGIGIPACIASGAAAAARVLTLLSG